MNAPASTARPRVLFQTHNLRHAYLVDFVAHACRADGWRLGILSQYDDHTFYDGLTYDRADFFLLPDIAARAAWEDDPASCAAVTEAAAECERKTGVPLHRVALAGERTIGRGYAREFYHWPSTGVLRAVLRDNGEPARMLLRLFAHIDGVLDTFRPDVIVAGQVSSPDGYVLALAAEARGIPVVINRPSKILSGRCFWTTDRSMLNTEAERVYAETDTPASEEARARLETFRENPATVDYIRRNWDIAATRTVLKRHLELASRALAKAKWLLTGRKGPEPKPALAGAWELYLTTYRRGRQDRLFETFDDAHLRRLRYILIALHKEPELAINVQAAQWHSQKNLIAWLSANLPVGCRLLVREHRFNRGRRSTAFYRALKAYPGVTLISPLDPQFKYIRNADLIVSDNGTTGWEGLIFRKPVVSVARNYYQAVDLAEKVSDSSRLGEAIIRRLAQPDVADPEDWDLRLSRYIDAEMKTTLPQDASSHDAGLATIKRLIGVDA